MQFSMHIGKERAYDKEYVLIVNISKLLGQYTPQTPYFFSALKNPRRYELDLHDRPQPRTRSSTS